MFTKKDIQYMRLCVESSKIFSTCSKRKYCAVLIDDNGHIVGFGYNGGPSGFEHCDEGGCPRSFNQSPNGSVYDDCIAIHAEQNAIIHCNYSSRPQKIYVNGPPCFTCAKLIANTTIKDVYYIEDESYADWEKVNSFLLKANINLNKIKKEIIQNASIQA
jgi:dCMP deaminase